MNYSAGTEDETENELQRIPALMRAFLERRAQQILQSQQTIGRLQGSIRGVMFDIAHVLAATPSAGNQAVLERSFSELKGLVSAVSQTNVPNVEDAGTKRTDVDLTGIKTAIEARADSPTANGASRITTSGALTDSGDKIKKDAAPEKELPSLDAAPTSGVDQGAPGDTKPITDPGDAKPTTTDASTSNVEQVKLALAKGGDAVDPSSATISDLLPSKPSARLNAGALKRDHAEAVTKQDAPNGQVAAQAVDPTTAKAVSVKPEPVVAAVRKLPSPTGA
jgi:hypothetical protein